MNPAILNGRNSDQPFLPWLADRALTPFAICTGQHKTSDGKTHQIGIRIIAGLVALILFPITLLGLTVKWLKRDAEENQQNEERSPPPASTPFDPELTQDEVADSVRSEFAAIQPLDPSLGKPSRGSWRAFGETHGEVNQTYEMFIEDRLDDQQAVHVQRVGTFSQEDLKIIAITSDFLKAIHGVPVKLHEETLNMGSLKESYLSNHERGLIELSYDEEEVNDWMVREKAKFEVCFPRAKGGQYDASLVLDCMRFGLKPAFKTVEDQSPQIICLTSEDLYTQEMQNFVFGLAYLGKSLGVGIWSKSRFGDPSQSPKAFESCLLRMMKISSHEFGHMRGLPHCTDYECNIGGYMSLTELDQRPLLFCSQDSAKICYLNRTPLLNHQRILLHFFENFNRNYKLNVDFSREITKLKARITRLEELQKNG